MITDLILFMMLGLGFLVVGFVIGSIGKRDVRRQREEYQRKLREALDRHER